MVYVECHDQVYVMMAMIICRLCLWWLFELIGCRQCCPVVGSQLSLAVIVGMFEQVCCNLVM
jgi:hypothetical protein